MAQNPKDPQNDTRARAAAVSELQDSGIGGEDMAAELARLRKLLGEQSLSSSDVPYATFDGDVKPIDEGGREIPERHYTTIPDPEKDEAGMMNLYDAMQSPTQPGKAMYRFESKNPVVTGDRRVHKYSCLMVDVDAKMDESQRLGETKLKTMGTDREPAFNGREGQEYTKITREPLRETVASPLVGIDPNSIVR